ncbi:phosphatidic acid phosphatase [Sorangium cellulosum]|uniref:Phosphatidic acid phosphatase n=1 Tax=Sorangium cellulosum TaxID=56 RepID=A0A2L0ETK2_SORCE|nr:phosphatase PAP2 family protein [Sorangium cellulosum]AUX42620.1 phosphatidic acid phosphatase [Sorangium cellulosum]
MTELPRAPAAPRAPRSPGPRRPGLARSARRRGARAAATLALAITLAAGTGAAAEPAPSTRERDRITYDVPLDLAITVATGTVWLGTQLRQDVLTAKQCRWCDRDEDGTDALNGLDRAMRSLRWSNTGYADDASNALGYVIAPLVSLHLAAIPAGLDGRIEEAPVNALLMLETTFVASSLTQIVKFAVGRERPFVHYRSEPVKRPSDNNVSFFSAHTNFAFAMAVSNGTIATLRGYRHTSWVWAAGLPLAAGIGYLRIAADRHYFTDVLTGAVVGTLSGVAIPLLFHRRAAPPTGRAGFLPSSVSASGTGVAATWRW